MFKKIVLIALLGALAFVSCNQQMMGGWKTVDTESMLQLQEQDDFIKAVSLVREEFSSEHNSLLGAVLKVETQVVSGINYKILFNSENGQYEAVVYVQPWTDTFEVLEIKPYTDNL